MDKNRITVFVAGQKLTLVTTDSEKYVSDIASKVETVINSLLSQSNMSREKCAVMAALDFCDDEAKARKVLSEIKEQIKDYIEETSKLRDENAELRQKVEKLTQELESKKTRIAVSVTKSEETSDKPEVSSEISADDDLSFGDDEEEIEVVEDEEPVNTDAVTQIEQTEPKPVEKAADAPVADVRKPRKSDKKRHDHSHVNPYRERFLSQQNADRGYTPVRQYSLFDEEDE